MAVPFFRSVVATSATVALALGLTACLPGSDSSSTSSASSAAPTTVKVVVHDSFQISDELIAEFEKSSGYDLQLVSNGDGGALVNKLVLTKDAPLGDVAFGVDNTFASRALNEGVFDSYEPQSEGAIGKALRIEGDDKLTPIDFGDVCLNLDSDYFAKVDLAEPLDKDGFFNPANAGLAVVTNPATSSPGLAFLFATIAKFGEDGYLDYWKQLKANGLKIVDSWEDAYYVDFTATGKGDKPIVLSYASSPAFTVTDDGKRTTTESLMSSCFRQVEYAGVLANAENPEGAKAFIDFLLGADFQSTIAEAMYMYPVNQEVELPEAWASFAPLPETSLKLSSQDITDNREKWIKEWSAEILG